MTRQIEVYRGLLAEDRTRLTQDLRRALEAGAVSGTEESPAIPVPSSEPLLEIQPFPELIGIDPTVYRQINAALQGGKRHIMLYGPPGTGKTTLAQKIAAELADSWTMITGSADWSSQDVIGGYQPLGSGEIGFVPGVLLRNFDRPIIIDELNRCDIDKVIGPLFTVLSGHPTTLPYREKVADKNSAQYVILPEQKSTSGSHEFSPAADWRIIATINSIDKAALYQMSYALTRRFAWIYLDAPNDLDHFMSKINERELHFEGEKLTNLLPMVAAIWRAVNQARVMGPAPFIDMLKSTGASAKDGTVAQDALKDMVLDAFYMFLLPMLDGIPRIDAERVASTTAAALDLSPDDERTATLTQRLVALAM